MLKYINVRMKKLKNEITKFLHYLNFKLFLSYSIANYIYCLEVDLELATEMENTICNLH